jgi:hypothetical protein
VSTHGNRTHGKTKTPAFRSWQMMRQRCNNPRDEHYKNYGARGIRVHPAWERFEAFFADMGERPAGTTLDRKDSNGNYEPGNCRWATNLEQHQNRRDNVLVEHEGERLSVAALARRVGAVVKEATFRARLAKGWSVERAATTAVNQGEGDMAKTKKAPEKRLPSRQGDVLILPVDALPEGLAPAAKDPRGVVLAEGESSGHFHRLFGTGAKLFQRAGSTQRFVSVGHGGAIRVLGDESRHAPVKVAPGAYECRTQRSWTSENASREVQD